MDSKSLMIGDWVHDIHGYQRKVNAIWEGIVVVAECKLNNNTIIAQSRHFASVIKPVPLTAEILEKNGWERDVDKEWKYNNSHILPRHCYQWERRNVKIEMDKGLEGFTTSLIIGRRFYYVHELQHVLRLCGLTELADSFKID